MLFDPVLNELLSDEVKFVGIHTSKKKLICSHCYRPIKDKYYQSGDNFYDEYCWQFKFVIDPIHIQRASRKSALKTEENE